MRGWFCKNWLAIFVGSKTLLAGRGSEQKKACGCEATEREGEVGGSSVVSVPVFLLPIPLGSRFSVSAVRFFTFFIRFLKSPCFS